jgi:hypothetical protein
MKGLLSQHIFSKRESWKAALLDRKRAKGSLSEKKHHR